MKKLYRCSSNCNNNCDVDNKTEFYLKRFRDAFSCCASPARLDSFGAFIYISQ